MDLSDMGNINKCTPCFGVNETKTLKEVIWQLLMEEKDIPCHKTTICLEKVNEAMLEIGKELMDSCASGAEKLRDLEREVGIQTNSANFYQTKYESELKLQATYQQKDVIITDLKKDLAQSKANVKALQEKNKALNEELEKIKTQSKSKASMAEAENWLFEAGNTLAHAMLQRSCLLEARKDLLGDAWSLEEKTSEAPLKDKDEETTDPAVKEKRQAPNYDDKKIKRLREAEDALVKMNINWLELWEGFTEKAKELSQDIPAVRSNPGTSGQ